MTRHRLLIALVALIAVSTTGAVIYLETSSSGSAAPMTRTSTTTSTTTTTSTVPPTTVPPSTTLPTTVPPTTLPPTTLPPPERALVPVVVSSGPSNGARVAPQAFLLGTVGWSDIRPLNGSVALTQTTVFFVEGLQAAAEMLAVDAGLPITSVAPMVDAPPVAGLANAQLLFYFGGA